MSEDLRDKISTAIGRAELVARHSSPRVAGNPGMADWRREGDLIKDGIGAVVARHVSAPDGDLIALNDPAAVLRRCAADRRVLERHRPLLNAVSMQPVECTCGEDWMCPEVPDLAERWGVEVEA